ncbi:ATPase family protein associated with various cellular activities (AAA) [Streptomyces sp. BK208]|uniref:DNA repair ATPase n=1 Tax=Streptomyces sp. BK208 TaxID=2512150 RepID=UPI0010EF62E8|nr:DNA repair ATPase [Streptomyces sp. BK208]TDT37265.1 ATPase family protein associated with various cellular activities (AAA) [Streptomyces sp. BK208]
MATAPETGTPTTTGAGARDAADDAARDAADAGAYEVLRDRLAAQAADLAHRARLLNARRVEEFGSARLELASTGRLRTEHPGVPCDVVAVGDVLLLGSTGRPARREGTAVADVLTLYDRDLNPLPGSAVPGLLDDPAFVREFTDLHRYYRQARLLRLRPVDGRLLAVFRTGEKADDIRVLRWELTDDGRAAFLDARGERDDVFPAPYDFEWTGATREDHVLGRHPHVSVRGEFCVSAVGGTLTVKLEDDTETADGIYSEPVDEPLQSLADADIAHARVGALILLRVRPYKEDTDRHLVFNTLTKSVVRLDGVGAACRRLPDDQGIVFPGGYCLATGVHKTYELDATGLEFEREVRSPNGEDVLYAFHARGESRGLLLSYNTIRKEVVNPLACRGWALAEDGTFTVLRADGDEPAQVHPVQLWHSPYVSDTYAADAPAGDGPLARVGNADLVRGISACLSVAGAAGEGITTAEGYRALAASCVRAADGHHWLGEEELGGLAGALAAVRETAEQVLAEFETVRDLTRRAAEARDEAAERIAAVVRRLRGEAPREAAAWVRGLTELRHAHGHLLNVKELRYADLPGIDVLAEETEASLAELGRRAVAFLTREDAFDAQREDVERLVADAGAIGTVAEAGPVAARLDELADGLRTVTDVVAELDTGDATVRTALLERVSGVLGGVNRARATLDARRRALVGREGRAEFAAETALLGQAVTAALAAADTPERCDDQLARLLARLEDLESRFAEFDGFLTELAGKRAEMYDALTARKQALADTRARRAEQLAASAARILETITRRCAALADADAVSTYFASDPMPAKVRRTAEELRALGDTARAEELDGRLASARQEAARALRDRTDLYADDGRTLRLGAHRFAVNTQPLDLTLVPDGDGLAFALTGTDYRSPVTDPDLAAGRTHWDRTLPSESPAVYRAEHLAARLLREHGASTLAGADDLAALVREAAREAYDEGYERGVHDHDATVVLRALLPLYERAGTLVHEPAARAAAQLFWAHGTTPDAREAWTRRARSLARARDTFGLPAAIGDLEEELARAVGAWLGPGRGSAAPGRAGGAPRGTDPADGAAGPVAGAAGSLGGAAGAVEGAAGAVGGVARSGADHAGHGGHAGHAGHAGHESHAGHVSRAGASGPEAGVLGLLVEPSGSGGDAARAAASYLFHELTTAPDGFVLGAGTRTLLDKFRRTVGSPAYDEDLAALDGLAARGQLAGAWISSYATATGTGLTAGDLAEAVAAELCPDLPRYEGDAAPTATAEGLLGAHPRITGGRLPLRLDEFLARTARFAAEDVPGFRAYQRRRGALVDAERERLRLDDHRPRVMSAFVRNRLVDEVYLPLVGDSLAKQLGTTGDGRRTGTGGLLLLLSPPGYGKTTLVEYVAERLGLMLVKVSGPALGHGVTSLDPADAPNATARREVEKINFALAAANNTLLYLDDIQHTSPELLQQFIPLCDATRRVEGVRDGRPRSYDLRGKRFAVCMAGNPYTESGARFQVPDMLANRADVWNLGDVLTGKEEAFALSFLENALTANPVLAPLAGGDRADLELLVRLATGDPTARADRLAFAHPPAELERVLSVLRHLVAVRETVLAVNAAYIASAAQADDTRTEPAFRLQGSYRNMNKIAQRVRPVMNDAERAAVLDDHYTAEAQTLTHGAEANLLKLAELRGTLTSEEAARWAEVRAAHVRARTLGGPGDDPLARAVAALGLLADRVAAVESAITRAAGPRHRLTADPRAGTGDG